MGSLNNISLKELLIIILLATQRENLGLIPKHFSINPKVSQLYGFFSPTEEIGKFIYQKHKYESKENYQHLYSLNAMEIEA